MGNVLRRTLQPAFSRLPRKFVKHYVRPLMVTRPQVPYDAKKFFESYHIATLGAEFSDRITISPTISPLCARFHYNALENSIIEYIATARLPQHPSLLDIGSGSGHWIDFYRDVVAAKTVVGIEISQPCAEALRRKYASEPGVRILHADIASPA